MTREWVLNHVPSHPVSSWVIRHGVYPFWLRRNHPCYFRYARQFHKTQHFSADELHHWQSQRLREQLLHAFRNIPFYRRRFEMTGMTPLDIQTSEDLKALPVLTRTELQKHGAELLASNIPLDQRVSQQTSGAKGMPVQFWVDTERIDSRRASLDRHNAWAGLRPGTWYAHLSGSPVDAAYGPQEIRWRDRFLDRRLTLNTSLISDEDLARFVQLLRRFRPRVLVAYAQSAVLFARYCEQNDLRDIHFRSIIVTAEMLLPGQRALLEDVFHAQVFNRYSSKEFSVIASDCPELTGMHLNADALIVEVEPSARHADGTGRVLVTDLLNRAMPLIRYEVGDIATALEATPCPCGRVFPRIANLRGRVTDFLVTPDHYRISGVPLASIAADLPQVRQVQLLQTEPARVQLRVVPGEQYSMDTVAELRRRLNVYFRGKTDINVVTVERIQPQRLGKFRLTQSSVHLSDSFAGRRIA